MLCCSLMRAARSYKDDLWPKEVKSLLHVHIWIVAVLKGGEREKGDDVKFE